MIRPIIQPAPSFVAPTVLSDASLTASAVSGPCPHMLYVSVSTAHSDKVLVEYQDASGNWTSINSSGVTGIAKPLGLTPPSRVDNLYNNATTSYLLRMRAKPGFLCDTLYATVSDNAPLPGAYLRGCAGFKATLSGSSPKLCTIQLVPGGSCGQVRRTAFTEFTGKVRLYVYGSLPANTSSNIPPPQHVSADVALDIVPPNERGVYQATVEVPSSFTSVYVLPLVSWTSADCSLCVDASFVHPTADGYPLILAAEAP